jgi:hypothetical protein
MHVKRNIQVRSCNYCCSGKEINITYLECMSVALGTEHAMRMRHVIRGPFGSTIFFYITS